MINLFGKKIKDEREKRGLSVDDVSLNTGINKQELIDIENGTLFPNVRHLMTISKSFGNHEGFFLHSILFNKKNEQ